MCVNGNESMASSSKRKGSFLSDIGTPLVLVLLWAIS